MWPNYTVVTDPSIRQPGLDLPHHPWSLMKHFRTKKEVEKEIKGVLTIDILPGKMPDVTEKNIFQ